MLNSPSLVAIMPNPVSSLPPHAPAVFGRYKILAEIGRGSMGVVYKAHDPKLDRLVAIKTILLFGLNGGDEREYLERFHEEARAAGRLSHPGIVTVFDVEPSPENGAPYIVMEYVEGKPLNQLLADNQGRLPMGPALRLSQELAEALQLAHSQGVLHRDIKPENILVTPDGKPKIADFGVAHLDHGNLTVPGRMLGSPAFMSPEQLEGAKIDARSDLFSLGVVLYTMLTGHRPFQGNSTATVCFKLANRDPIPVSSWNLDFPRELDELVGRAMAKDPGQRFQSGAEMAAELKRFREAHEVEPQPLAGIMRIIGQETLPISAAVEETPDGDSLEDVVSRALTRHTSQAIEAQPQPAKALSKPTEKTAPAFQQELKKPPLPISRIHTPQGSSYLAYAVLAAIFVAVIGFTLWTIHKQPHVDAQASLNSPSNHAAREITSQQGSAADHAVDSVPPAAGSTGSDRTDRTLHRQTREGASVAREAPPQPRSSSLPVAAKAQARNISPPIAKPEQASSEPLTVQMVHLSDLRVTIDHSFQEAQASVSVDNRAVYSETLLGEKKRRALIFTHIEGRQSGTITLLPGKHDIVVHVQSAKDSFDASQTLTEGFAPGSKNILLVKCDKRKKKLELAIQPDE